MSTSSVFQRHRRAVLGAVAGALVLSGAVFGPQLGPSFGVPSAIAQQRADARPAGFADIVERVKPAVVSVQIRRDGDRPGRGGGSGPELSPGDPLWRFLPPELRERFRDPGGRGGAPSMGQGSGFFISADGVIVTNRHVVDGANEITVVLDDGTRLPARLVAADDRTDIAVIRVEAQGRTFSFVPFARTQPRVGDWVIAIGNPFGLGGTVTAGIVSARGRDIGSGAEDFVQIDAPVNRGNSGGPTFNADGEVIGINTAIYSPSGGSVGIGFAIPASVAEPIVAQLREGGSVTRGWLGVQIQSVTDDIARSLGMARTEGAIVAEPQPNSPAARAGIRSGDVIVGLNGEPVRDARDLTRRVGALRPGQEARFEILRGGDRQTVAVTIGRLGEEGRRAQGPSSGDAGKPGAQAPATASLDRLGLQLSPGRNGVVVSDVAPNSVAAQRGLREGDVIVDVGGQEVARPADVATRIEAARSAGRSQVLLLVRSQNGMRFIPLPTDRT
jgi:serine protease Do